LSYGRVPDSKALILQFQLPIWVQLRRLGCKFAEFQGLNRSVPQPLSDTGCDRQSLNTNP